MIIHQANGSVLETGVIKPVNGLNNCSNKDKHYECRFFVHR